MMAPRMQKVEVLQRIREVGIVPVLRATSAEDALAIAVAIEAGGIPVVEVTMTVPGALDVIRALASQTSLLVGAGTVLDPETARACILAGAGFIVSPALNLATIAMCRRYGVAVMPGALTPTEILHAWEAGADVVKVFPCNAMGGATYLNALKGPFPYVDLLPTGGVSLATAGDFLTAGAFAVGVGGELVDHKAIARGHLEAITQRAELFRAIVQRVRGS